MVKNLMIILVLLFMALEISWAADILGPVEWNNDINYVSSLSKEQIDQIRLVPRKQFSIIKDVFWKDIPNFWVMYFGVDKEGSSLPNANATLGLQIIDYYGKPVIYSIVEPITYEQQKADDTGIRVVSSPNSLYFVYGKYGANLPPTIYWIYKIENSILSANITFSASVGKEGHTSHYYLPANSPSPDGSVLIFGGYDGNYTNQLGEFYIKDQKVVVNFSLPTGPSPRAWHSSLITLDGNIWVFGGKNSGSYFSDLWKYNYYSQIWTKIDTGALDWPTSRAGHTMLFGLKSSTLPDESGFYIYGGDNGTQILSDFWYFNISSNIWTKIVNEYVITPTARAYHAGFSFFSPSNNDTTLIYYGGVGSDRETLSTFSTVDLYNPDCQISCPLMKGNPCVPFEVCYDNNRCDWKSSKKFQCGLGCFTNLSICQPVSTCTQFRCWNGKCASSVIECDPIPFCDIGMKRCSDGNCVSENIACTPVTCTSGKKLCVDGTCNTECPPYFGCLPDNKPVMCGDGTCAASFKDCNANCSNELVKCSDRCDTSCSLPDWSYNVYAQFQANNFYTDTGQFVATGPYIQKADAIGLYFNFLVNKTQTYTVSIKSLTPDQIQSIGPHPHWTMEFDPAGLTGAWMINYQTTAKPNEVTFDFAAAINSPESPSDRNDTGHVNSKYCIAAPHLWYWDPFDISDKSGLIGVPYIDEFRRISKAYSSGGFYIPPEASNISTPLLRWKCLTDAQFGWPVTVGVTVTEGLLRYGIHITVAKGAYALLYLPTVEPTPEAVLPKMRDTNYGVLGFAAVLLFVLLLIVGYKVIVKKK